MICAIASFLWSPWTLVFTICTFAIYKWSTATFDYFEKKNIPYDKPWPLFGNFPRMLLQMEPGFETMKNFYLKHKHRKQLNLGASLPSQRRNDVIASCAFGLKMNSHSEKENEFYQRSKKAINFGGWVIMKVFLYANFKKIMKFFKISIFDTEFAAYFRKIVTGTMQKREEQNLYRPDMIQILMDARKGTLHSQDLGMADAADGFAVVQEAQYTQPKVSWNWTDDELMAQCFLFFLAGYETSSTAMSFCAQELMENPEAQQKLINEIDRVRKELGGEPLKYETLQNMKYMDMVVSETLRKWPPAIGNDRVCTKPCTIEDEHGGHAEINPGDIIAIPAVGLHYDPNYFPNPNKFDPERFNDVNKEKIKPFTYLPFGVGPRSCIGSRFALMEVKAMLFHLLSEFTLEASAKSTVPIKLANTAFALRPKNGFWMNFKPRKISS